MKRSVDIATWRMTKTFGDSVFKDGKQFHWCPHHKYNRLYDGLYVTHPPEKHAEWKENQDKWERENSNKENNHQSSNMATPSSSLSSNSKLVLSDKFKQVMLTDQGFLELQLEQLMRSLSEN